MDALTQFANETVDAVATANLTTSKHSESDRTRALAIYAETNSIAEAARQTGIAQTTIHYWLQDDEVQAVVVRLRSAIREQAAWNYVEIIGLAQREVLKRLKYGEEHVTKSGDIVLLPVKARDAILIASVAQDKLANLTAGLEGQSKANRHLNHLAKQLLETMQAAQAVKPDPLPEPSTPGPASAYMG